MTNPKWLTFWLTIGVVALVGELVAAFNGGPGDTLSEQVWAVLDLGAAFWIAGAAAFVTGAVLLFKHFFLKK